MILKFDVWGTSCHIEVNLEEICKTEDEKVEVENRAGKWVLKKSYPADKRRKLFKLIIENNEDEILDDVEQYLADNTKTFAQEFSKMREVRA